MTHRLPWWLPQLTGEESARLEEVLDSNYLNDGSETREFEERIADLLGARYAVGVTSGTSALALSLMAAGIGPGDEVLVPDVTFIATANAVTLAGATTVLVDAEPERLTISVEAAAEAITTRTRAIIPVHVTGRAADMEALLELAGRHDLVVIEDAAEALTSRAGGKALGTYGLTGCFSFSPNKTITTGQGGLVVTDDEAVHRRLRELKDQGRPEQGTGGDDAHPSIGFNFKLTNLQAAVGLAQLSALEERVERMRAIHHGYRRALDGLPGLRVLPFDLDRGEVPQWTDVLVDRRDALDRFLADNGADCRRFWHPLHTQPPYRAPDSGFPNSTELLPCALWLPSAFTMSDADVQRVSGLIGDFLTGDASQGSAPAG